MRPLFTWLTLTVVGLMASLFLANLNFLPVVAQTPRLTVLQSLTYPTQLEQEGAEAYARGEFDKAVNLWELSARAYQKQGDILSQTRVLNNLALAYQDKGAWQQANQTIQESLNLLTSIPASQSLPALAQALNNQGILQLAQGKTVEAALTWQKAREVYEQAQDKQGILRSEVNQARALQQLGQYPRACKLLMSALNLAPLTCQEVTTEELAAQMKSAPKPFNASQIKGWCNLADVLRFLDKLEQSELILETLVQQIPESQERGEILLSLGNTALIKGEGERALELYQKAAQSTTITAIAVSSQLSQLSLLIKREKWAEAGSLLPKLTANLEQLPISQGKISAQINLADSLIHLQEAPTRDNQDNQLPSWRDIAQLLSDALQQAQQLGDKRSETYALGNLARVYQKTQQWAIARELSQQALALAQAINAAEITYRWQWQLGKIFQAQGEREQAIISYAEAVKSLESLGGDIVSNPQIQFSFQENIEPVYREFVSLLLQPDWQGKISQENLAKARQIIEDLQVAELNNFFREACLEVKPVKIDTLDAKTAIFYPIILGNRLTVILSVPQQPLHYYQTAIARESLESAIENLRYTLVIRSRRGFFTPAQQLYDWLIRPAETYLGEQHIETLVFVPDGILRNIPIASLHDGEYYLIEKYQIAIAPGLQLIEPKPLQQRGLNTLAAGLTQAREGFSSLKFVSQELQAIASQVPSLILLNRDFTENALGDSLEDSSFPIIHIATHGQFSSNFKDTFLITWDKRLDISELADLLQARIPKKKGALEMLVLSACETATGDRRAALGLAGMAVRAGARSTLATLWSVNDEATTEFMSQFYRALASQQVTKAQALRQARLSLLNNPRYQHPFYWAAYILVGNWL